MPAPLNVRVGCEFVYDALGSTTAIALVAPAGEAPVHIVDESWTTDPAIAVHRFTDIYQNPCRRLTVPPGRFSLRYEANVVTEREPAPMHAGAVQHPVEHLPDATLLYTLPSRYCLSDTLQAQAWDLFGGLPMGWDAVQGICDWVHGNIAFRYGASDPLTTAADVLANREGVCRDFAHLAITFCRALAIPARYVFGYLPDVDIVPTGAPMDFCAWFEAYLGDRWWTFDPRNNVRRVANIPIGRGRDALDVAMMTTYGPATFETMTVWADET